MFNQVGGHSGNELEAVLHVLGLSIAILLLFRPSSNDNDGGALANASTSTSGGKLSDSLLVILVGEHIFLTFHSDTSLRWASVSIGSSDSAGSLVDRNILGRTIQLLERVIISGKTSEVTSLCPQRAIMTVKSGTAADVLSSPVIGVIIEFVQNLIGVSLPSVLSHCVLI